MTTLAHIMRCVLMTPLGNPVEPEVNRYFATVSPVIALIEPATAGPAGARSKSENGVALGRWSVALTTSMSCRSSAFRARATFSPL